MARNYEKNFGRLNRLWLEKGTVKREKRPKLRTLKTPDEISFWLPSIKEELDFFLKQTEVPCYTDHKIDECRQHIHYLEAEYKSFVRKFHQLNSHVKSTPWTARPYEKKHESDSDIMSLHPMRADAPLAHISSLQTPVLMHDHLYDNGEISVDFCDQDTQSDNAAHGNNQNLPLFESHVGLKREPSTQATDTFERKDREPTTNSCSKISIQEVGDRIKTLQGNALGLDYSSSEEET